MNDRLTQVIIGKKKRNREKKFCLEYGWEWDFFICFNGIVAMCDSNRRGKSWRCVFYCSNNKSNDVIYCLFLN